jgi:hypothetical protein
MTTSMITKLQKQYGYYGLQQRINTGLVWLMEGSGGRDAMEALRVGVCMLPKHSFKDYYGGKVPSRDELIAGTKGTYKNCADFWTKVENGEIFIDEEVGICY